MQILYVGMKHDYGDPSRGLSFEHHNFYESLRNQGHEIEYFDFADELSRLGRRRMNRRLLELTRSTQPDLLFSVLFKNELSRKTLRTISHSGWTRTVNWFCDDHWRFDSFSRHWAPCFNWIVTTDSRSVARYNLIGISNVIKSQWACNPDLYRRLDLPLLHDVTFVGQPHGNRRAVIEALRQAGIRVKTWGRGWPEGRVSQRQMIEIFNQSRINLNLSNASVSPATEHWTSLARQQLRHSAGRTLDCLPLARRIYQNGKRRWQKAPEHDAAALPLPPNASLLSEGLEQIKGRNFEVPACGGCLLTGAADDLGRYYVPGREVICFDGTMGKLIEQIHSLLKDDSYCREVAEAGYQRTLREHTYAHRFSEIFRRMGLPEPNSSTHSIFAPADGPTYLSARAA